MCADDKRYAARKRHLSGLNEDKFIGYIENVRREVENDSKPSNLLFQNCSSVVAGALLAGADKDFWTI